MIQILDNFLPTEMFEQLRQHADTLSFDGVLNPVDGVIYPGISTNIPDRITKFLWTFAGRKPNALFMRLSLKGVPVPHQAHTDSLMGNMSLMLYINRAEHAQGGTAFVQHKKIGLMTDPRDQFEEKVWQLDTNKKTAWKVYDQIDMRPNRAAVFPAKLMHRAEPVGGFGDNAVNGRLVLTMFY